MMIFKVRKSNDNWLTGAYGGISDKRMRSELEVCRARVSDYSSSEGRPEPHHACKTARAPTSRERSLEGDRTAAQTLRKVS